MDPIQTLDELVTLTYQFADSREALLVEISRKATELGKWIASLKTPNPTIGEPIPPLDALLELALELASLTRKNKEKEMQSLLWQITEKVVELKRNAQATPTERSDDA
jgi:hypothetical protein